MKEALKLTEAEEQHLHIFVHRGKANARSITRANSSPGSMNTGASPRSEASL